jgi:hypothetical protein
MKMLKLFGYCLLLAALFSGCATIDTTATRLYSTEYGNVGTISVVASLTEVNNSLEFLQYKPRFERILASNGYTIVSDPIEAKYVALVAYGLDEGKSGVVSTSVIVEANGKSATLGTYYTMPIYGSSTASTSQYMRAIAMDIVDTESIVEGTPKTIFEIRTKSVGPCSSIAGVFDEMLEAMFKGFPGEAGKINSTTLRRTKDDC